jgi:hypothetical protein
MKLHRIMKLGLAGAVTTVVLAPAALAAPKPKTAPGCGAHATAARIVHATCGVKRAYKILVLTPGHFQVLRNGV